MSTMSEDEDPDEIFRQIMQDVVLAEPHGAIAYHLLTDVELSMQYHTVRKELHDSDTMFELNPVGRAADLHSQWSAIGHECRRRWPQGEPPDSED